MIKRLFVDNYKCFVNFDTYFGSQTLIVGENGVGKTTLFEVLDALRRFMTGIEYVSDIFPESSLTRWQQAYVQTFEVDVQEQADTFRYHLEAEHEKGTGKCRVISEWLTENDNLLFRFENSKAYLYRDNYTVGPEYPASWSRSGLGSVAESADNTKLTRFRERMSNVLYIQLRPFSDTMPSRSLREEARLEKDGSNFTAWYRFLRLTNLTVIINLQKSLQEIWERFEALEPESVGRGEMLLSFQVTEAQSKRGKLRFDWEDLSEGQRALIILYTLIHYARSNEVTLCLDEPDNFMTLREVQPLLYELRDALKEGLSQTLIVSHHPEVLDHYAPSERLVLKRLQDGATTLLRKIYEQDGEEGDDGKGGISFSEIQARGWDE